MEGSGGMATAAGLGPALKRGIDQGDSVDSSAHAQEGNEEGVHGVLC